MANYDSHHVDRRASTGAGFSQSERYARHVTNHLTAWFCRFNCGQQKPSSLYALNTNAIRCCSRQWLRLRTYNIYKISNNEA